MALVRRLKQVEAEWSAPDCSHRHPAFAGQAHPLAFNLGRIEGGEWPSSVPLRCSVDMRLGFYPGQTPESVRAAVLAAVEEARRGEPALAGAGIDVTWQGFQAAGCEIDPEHPLIRLLAGAHQLVRGEPARRIALECTTDARFFSLHGGIPATCYGPEASAIHGIDESVSLDSMHDVTAVLALFIAGWCGVEPLENRP
jgi:acetylornithine deacetylase